MNFIQALDKAQEYRRKLTVEQCVVKRGEAYEPIATDMLKPEDLVVAQLQMILYEDYMHGIAKWPIGLNKEHARR